MANGEEEEKGPGLSEIGWRERGGHGIECYNRPALSCWMPMPLSKALVQSTNQFPIFVNILFCTDEYSVLTLLAHSAIAQFD